RGASRRFEVAGRVAGVTVVDDYAHHPTAVAVTVAAARARAGEGRVIALYVPHTYTRTRALLHEHARAFDGADVVRIGPIEAARERRMTPTASHLEVVDVVRPHVADVAAVDSPDAAATEIAAIARPGDLVVVLSLGGFDKVAARIVGALRARHGAGG
ncbi:MAG TPA: cyanophycin synthetase, partial [Candidatus Dormibacteraeota bacterium]|nr:cyanophycin synthetase [Candidatus Dormibacteraeota bacterium]